MRMGQQALVIEIDGTVVPGWEFPLEAERLA